MIYKNFIKKWYLLLSLLLIACGGGGGGGGSNNSGGGISYNVPSCSDTGTSYQTSEYYWMDYYDRTNQALARVCASTAYANGATGSGVKVAVIDTGIYLNINGTNKHREFGTNGASLPNGKLVIVEGADSVNQGSSLNDNDNIPEDGDGHGTHVAATIGANKDGLGMHGIAYEATLYPIKIMDPYDYFWNASAWGLYRALINNVDIVNNSWTMGGAIGSSCYDESSCEAWVQASPDDKIDQTFEYARYLATSGGIISVWAAGNDSYSNPGVINGSCIYNSVWRELCVVVVATGTDGKIASFSNRCGLAADYCIAAPGVDITAAGINHSTYYYNSQGTSMAAPLVSGGLALIKHKFSSLTNQQVIDRLLTTATDHDEYSQSSIYGHGMMDLGAATSNIASLQVLSMAPNLNLDDDKSKYSELSSNSITTSIAFDAALNNSLQDKTMEVYDSFDRANFEVNISAFINNSHLVNKYKIENHLNELSSAGGNYSLKENKNGTLLLNMNEDVTKSLFISNDNKLAIGNNISSNSFFLDTKRKLNLNTHESDTNYFDNPYFFKTDNDISMSYNLSNTSAEIFSGVEGENFGLSFNYLPIKHRPSQNKNLGNLELSFGVVLENEKVLNSHSAGVFTLSENSSTAFTGVKYKKNVGNYDIFANVYYGNTYVTDYNNSYIDVGGSILSNSYAIGVIKNNWLDKNQKIAFLFNQPQKIIDGQATLTVPVSSNSERLVTMADYNLSLVSPETQNNFNFYFEKNLNNDQSLHLNLTHIDNPYHDANRKSQNNLSVVYKKYF